MIPTASYMLIDRSKGSYEERMIEFAKLHVQEALKQASDKAVCYLNEHHPDEAFIDKQSILNAYSLTNIK